MKYRLPNGENALLHAVELTRQHGSQEMIDYIQLRLSRGMRIKENQHGSILVWALLGFRLR